MSSSPSVLDPPASACARMPNSGDSSLGGSRSARLPGLDGLRALAVVTVVLYHLGSGILPGGFIGVDVFFVISGYLITAVLVREKDAHGRIRLGRFWMRRARRLLPALGLVVVVSASAALLIGGNPLVHLGRQVFGAATFSSNWLSIAAAQNYFDETAPELFRNLWSLAVEEQFYLAWPLVILLVLAVRSRAARVLIVLTIAVASAAAMTILAAAGDPTRVYYGSDTHSFGLAIGAALAILHRDWPASSAALARRVLPAIAAFSIVGIVAIALGLPEGAPLTERGGLALVAVLAALAIAGTVISPISPVSVALDWHPLRWIGERSYGLYLWHWPVWVLVTAALPTVSPSAGGWLIAAIALAITVAAAMMSYRFVEQPIHQLGYRAAIAGWLGPRPRPAARITAIVTATLLIVAFMGATGVAIAADPGTTDAQALIDRGKKSVAPATPQPSSRATPPVTPSPSTGSPDASPAASPPASPPASLAAPPLPAPPLLAPAVPRGDQIDAIGDSVMLASAPELQAGFPGIQINAVVSRQLSSAPAIVQGMRDSGTLRPVLLIGLGTNGPIDRESLDQIRSIVGASHEIIVVNVQAPRGWTDGVNDTLTQFAQQYRSVELADWRDAISSRLDLLARDQIHPGSAGGVIYVRAVTDALQRLTRLPAFAGPRGPFAPPDAPGPLLPATPP
ncbi:acyltransferase family protein [Frigoribacterium sp. CG_9.8]|uniref:acyltransferase family protein n=1 Tax=Frigoribacterium sp. CG_9.8 TaxID=2787733 RepID=UPI0018C9EFBB|nr:acyltransferase family protein [Frigoribacterium sp. CG_9.8]MBG6108914.1 peptidoglycan/LPS O-acetylase OafA/YrhL [Frigoribacterium sp. CG_9.8]